MKNNRILGSEAGSERLVRSTERLLHRLANSIRLSHILLTIFMLFVVGIVDFNLGPNFFYGILAAILVFAKNIFQDDLTIVVVKKE